LKNIAFSVAPRKQLLPCSTGQIAIPRYVPEDIEPHLAVIKPFPDVFHCLAKLGTENLQLSYIQGVPWLNSGASIAGVYGRLYHFEGDVSSTEFRFALVLETDTNSIAILPEHFSDTPVGTRRMSHPLPLLKRHNSPRSPHGGIHSSFSQLGSTLSAEYDHEYTLPRLVFKIDALLR
jgi:hypothetical protein